jgi:hypothetical protein
MVAVALAVRAGSVTVNVVLGLAFPGSTAAKQF